MPTEDKGSVTLWLGALKAGDLAAARPLWDRYFAQLVRLARARLRAAPRAGAEADEEDAALSAFDSIEEIRRRVCCSLRKVTLKLALIRTLWDPEQPS